MTITKPHRIAPNIWFLEAPLNGITCSIYVIKGKRIAVIDTGYNFHPKQVIVPLLNQIDLNVKDVDIILNTHGHPDHLGGNAALQHYSGGKIYLHREDIPLSQGPEAHINSPTDHISAMRLLSWDDEVIEREIFIRERVDACNVDQILHDGDKIDLGSGFVLTVIHTPGHSNGSVTYYLESMQMGFTGDAVQGWGTQSGVLPLYYSPQAYVQSLNRINELNLETLCLGHNFGWSNPKGDSLTIRRGDEITQTLVDSKQFVFKLSGIVDQLSSKDTMIEKVLTTARSLQEAYNVQIDFRERIPASSAATIISHINKPLQAV